MSGLSGVPLLSLGYYLCFKKEKRGKVGKGDEGQKINDSGSRGDNCCNTIEEEKREKKTSNWIKIS